MYTCQALRLVFLAGHDACVDRWELADRLQEACRLTGRFTLRSGRTTEVYFDKYLFESDPVLLSAVAQLAERLVPPHTEMLAGLELGGVPIATALSLVTGIPQLLVRKQTKTYGTAKLAEGPEFSSRRLLVVEDVITTGGQVVASTEGLRARGALVDSVICVVDRRPSFSQMPDLLAGAGLSVLSLFTLDDLSKV